MSLKQVAHHLNEGRIYAIDRSAAMLKHAVGRADRGNRIEYHFVLADGLSVDLPKKVDAAVACFSLGVLDPEHFEQGAAALWRTLKPNGTVAIVETAIPEPRTQLQRIYQKLLKLVLLNVFSDKHSRHLMPAIERFEKIEVEHVPRFNAVAFLGRRRDLVLPEI